ncbi:MAG: hypothetical protein H8K03_16580 [Nitrospira sp.]
MFAGHIGAALAIGRAERRVNLGILVFAALLLDVMLWTFILLGWESVVIRDNFAATHQPEFIFPYSHSLLAAIASSALAGAAAFLWYPRMNSLKLRAAVCVATAVFSHWLLDALVHIPELPLAGENSLKVGLGMWSRMPVALSVEAFITIAGLCLFLAGNPISRARKFWVTALACSLMAFTAVGMTVAPPPPSVMTMASSSLATIIVVCVLAGWLGKRAP